MADPLTVLRDCILNNQDIREEDQNVYLGEHLLPKSTVTSFNSAKGQGTEVNYTLDALLFFLKNSSLPHAVYYNKAKTLGIQYVRRYDRKSLLKFLTGSSDNMTEITPVDLDESVSSPSNSQSPINESKSSPVDAGKIKSNIKPKLSPVDNNKRKSSADNDEHTRKKPCVVKTEKKKKSPNRQSKGSNSVKETSFVGEQPIQESGTASSCNQESSTASTCNQKSSTASTCNQESSTASTCNQESSTASTCNQESSTASTCNQEFGTTSTWNQDSGTASMCNQESTSTSNQESTSTCNQESTSTCNQESTSTCNQESVTGSIFTWESDTASIWNQKSGTASTWTQTNPDSQPATIQAYQTIISRLIMFLQDDLGLSREEQESVLEGKKINLRRVLQRTKTQRCFVAVPHPVYEWDTVKEDGAHVVSGQRINRRADDIERRYQCVLDNCLKRGETDLKDSLSLLISHMRDLNKSNLTEAEVDVSCKRTLEYCLTSAQEDFREMFESLLSVVDDHAQNMQLQRWISESEVELRKLLNSLMLSMQTLRDVSTCSRTLFHFPEPIVSIALNPTKVTHSVVLEIYVRLGLAELRRILVNIISSIEKARTASEETRRRLQSDSEGVDDPDETEIPRGERPASASSSSDPAQSIDSPSQRLVESIKNDWSVDEPDGSALFRKKPRSQPADPEQNSRSSNSKDKGTASNASAESAKDAFWKSNDLFSTFKTKIGSTLVTSFKKRIQEKIEASTTTEECITWLRTKKGLLPDAADG